VVGSEQISLFGLVLAPKRPIHYGALFPEEARHIFVRDALLTGEINTRSAFLARNLATLAKAKEEEAKQRRTGLVVDEEWQAQWYLDRCRPTCTTPRRWMPGTGACRRRTRARSNGRSLELMVARRKRRPRASRPT
jgi:HrpA-like RNA helicase